MTVANEIQRKGTRNADRKRPKKIEKDRKTSKHIEKDRKSSKNIDER
jgi:hypothetical protein